MASYMHTNRVSATPSHAVEISGMLLILDENDNVANPSANLLHICGRNPSTMLDLKATCEDRYTQSDTV